MHADTLPCVFLVCQIGTTNMGVVVYVGRETLKVLTQSGIVQTVHPPELRGKRNLARCAGWLARKLRVDVG